MQPTKCVVIPAHNEDRTVGKVVFDSLKHANRVIVVDDGSTDDTVDVARDNGAKVIELGKNYGYGFAITTGFNVAKEIYDIVVTIDADGQHNPSEIPILLEPIVKDEADIVIGSRFLQDIKIPFYRRFGIWLITLAFNLGKSNITDSQSGFRAFKSDVLRELNIEETGFGQTTEIMIKARKHGYRIKEVPISCSYRNLKEDSHMNPLRHGFDVIWATIKWRVKECN